MATSTAAKVENPKNLSDLNSISAKEGSLPSEHPPTSVGRSDESKSKEAASVKMSIADSGVAITDVQKKMKRAERFGMTVQLSEEEKRNTRAERFGTGTSVDGSDSSKTSEALKRKARAERFGTVQSMSADEEAKKKARLARFGSLSQADPVEEDKKKARAARFSNDGGLLLKENGKVDIEKKTAITAGNAGAGT